MVGNNRLHCSVELNPFSRVCTCDISPALAADLSDGIRTESSSSQPIIICLEIKGRSIYLSWSGKTYGRQRQRLVFLNRTLANLLGISEHDCAELHVLDFVSPYKSISIEPLKGEEWEFLELHMPFLEEDLLNQIRVVYPGLVFPVYMKGNATVNVRVCEVTPAIYCGYLDQSTEVVIEYPRQRNKDANDQLQNNTSESSIFCDDTANNQDNERTYVILNLEEDNQRNLKQLIDSYKDEDPNWDDWRHFASDFLSFEETSKQSVVPVMGVTSTAGQLSSSGSDTICEVLRVHPVSERDDAASYVNPDAPCRTYVSKSLYLKCCKFAVRVGAGDILIPLRLKTLYSPLEVERFKENREIVVEVCLQDEVYSKSTHQLQDYIYLLKPWMEHLRLCTGSLVELRPLNWSPSPVAGILLTTQDIDKRQAHPDWKRNVDIKSAFQRWIQNLKDSRKLILNEMTPISTLDGENQIHLIVKLLIKETNKTQSPLYSLYTVEELLEMPVEVAVKKDTSVADVSSQADDKSSSLLHAFSFKSTRESLGAWQDKHDTAVNHFVRHSLFPSATSTLTSNGAVLVCSTSFNIAAGCGRTTLCHAICDTLSREPYHAYTKVMDCISLRGKKVESIQDIWKKCIEEAKWHQPSVVCFDDLDQLVERIHSSELPGAYSFYCTKLAEAFADILKDLRQEKARIGILISSRTTTSLHPLLSHSPLHFIHHIIQLATPLVHEREEILRSIMKESSCTVEDISIIKDLAAKTEGFVPGDLLQIVRRARNCCLERKTDKQLSGCQQEAVLLPADIDKALTGFTPVSLHGLSLEKPNEVCFNDIGGLDKVKQILTETFVWPMKYSSLFSKITMRLTTGVLLYGVPGTGKTLLAGAIAKESGLNFITIKGPELLSKYIGSSEQNVRDLFAKARAATPSLLFFDEFDALAPRRGHDSTGVTDRVVNQLLTELDGVEALIGVYVLAASSRPDLIDPALLRPGRLDKAICCPLPDENERLQILLALGRNVNVSVGDLKYVCPLTAGYSGADMKALLFNAQLEAFHRTCIVAKEETAGKSDATKDNDSDTIEVTKDDLMKSLEKTPSSVSQEERRRYNERFRRFRGRDQGLNTISQYEDQRATLA